MTSSAVDRIQAEIDALSEQVTTRIIEAVPAYQADASAKAFLGPSVRQNADQVVRVLRGEPTDSAAARNVGLMTAVATGVPLEALLIAYELARDVFIERLVELAAEDEDVSEPIARLRAAHDMIALAVAEEYRAAQERRNG